MNSYVVYWHKLPVEGTPILIMLAMPLVFPQFKEAQGLGVTELHLQSLQSLNNNSMKGLTAGTEVLCNTEDILF